MSKDLTRRELFDLVWERPITKVAAELGISDVTLHKICDKHRVPAPGRGYWAKVAAGHKPPKAHFREISDQSLNIVRIYGSTIQALPKPVREAREKARIARIESEEREKVRRENERRARLHNKRLEYLEKLVTAAEKARRLEEFVETYLRRFPAEQLPELALLWIEWTRGNIDALYREITPETVVATLQKYGLDDDATDISSWVRID